MGLQWEFPLRNSILMESLPLEQLQGWAANGNGNKNQRNPTGMRMECTGE